MFGGFGNDVLYARDGLDELHGGQGDDQYSVERPDEKVIEFASEGYDEVNSSVSFTLPTNVETLFLTGNAIYGIGISGNNAIIGNDVANVLEAGEGSFEFMNGLGGDDLLIGGPGHDEIMEEAEPTRSVFRT